MPDLEERVTALEASVLGRLTAAEARAAEMEHRYDLATLRIRDMTEIPGPVVLPGTALTEDEVTEFRHQFEGMMRRPDAHHHRVLAQPPPLTAEQVRYLLRECVTVVAPGETLVIRGRDWTPDQVREIQRWMDAGRESGQIPFPVLVLPGDELGVVQRAGGS